MKKIIVLLVILLSVFPLFAENAVIKEARGRVEFQPPGGSWQGASTGAELPQGSSISTGFGSSAILEIGASTVTVDALTRMKLEELVQSSDSQTTGLFLRVGKVNAKVSRDSGLSHDFKLRSPSSTAAVRGTDFSYDGKKVTVHEGIVALFSPSIEREIEVNAGETSRVASNGKYSNPVAELVRASSTSSDPGKQENNSAQSGASQTSGAGVPPAAAAGITSNMKFYGDISITVK